MSVVLFTNTNYGGSSQTVGYTNWMRLDIAGSVSSIKVPAFTRVILYTSLDNALGTPLIIDGPIDIPDLGTRNYNDAAKSISVARMDPPLSVRVACCSQVGSGVDSTSCGAYYNGDSTECGSIMRAYCDIYPTSAECKSWCAKHDCDAAMLKYCATSEGQSDPYCSCINSKAQGLVPNPKCVDAKCVASGYLTMNMRTTPCPDIVNCEVKNTLQNSGVLLSPTFASSQNCGNGSSNTVPISGGGFDMTTIVIMFIVFLIIVIAAIIIGVNIVSAKKSVEVA